MLKNNCFLKEKDLFCLLRKNLHVIIMKKVYYLLVLFVVLISQNAEAQIIYVKSNASGSNNGTSWSNAYTDLQSALTSATVGDTIWVAAGTYKPTTDKTGDANPSDDRTKTFALSDSVFAFGGFAGTETQLSQRDIENNETILSGDIGTVGDFSDNCYNVIQTSNYDIISGFTITLGNANGAVSNETDMGGAILNKNVKAIKIDSCRITNCFGKQGGSVASYFCDDTIKISYCHFLDNTAGNGGAVGNWDTDPIISFCVFENNFADESIHTDWGMGGAIFNWGGGSTTKTINCTFINNDAKTAIIHDRGVHSSVKNSIFFKNKCNDFYYVGSVTYCLTSQSGYAGSNGNINANPLLYDRDNGTYEMSWVSPCIDSGDPATEYNDRDGSRNNIGASHIVFSPATDAFVFSVDTPAETFIYGNYSVSIKVSNIGTTTLTSMPIDWSVDGIAQTTYNWSGTLASPDTSEVITVGNYNFTPGKHIIKVWTSASADEYTGNDTLTKEVTVITNLDAGIIALQKPEYKFQYDSNAVFVSIKNIASDSSIYNLKIGWSVDGSSQTPYDYNDTIMPHQTIDSVKIGSFSFSRGNHIIKVWTYNPNGLPDDDNSNDTVTKTVYSISLDIGIANIIKPNNPDTAGTIPIIVSYKNYCNQDVTSTRIYWQINSETPQTYDKSGKVSPGETSDYFEIGSYNFASVGTYTLKVWTTNPNADGDDYHLNDTLTKEIVIGNPMCGTYIIGATGDIANFSDAVDSLIMRGINGDVIFKVQTGTYNESVTLPYIQGVSDSNTIIFQSLTADSTDVVLASSGNPAITLKGGVQYITFKNMTITADGSDIITLKDSAWYIEFDNNIIIGNSTDYTLYSSYGIHINDITFRNNHFKNGSNGIILGSSGNTIIIENNIFDNIKNRYVSFYKQKNTIVSKNIFNSTSADAIAVNIEYNEGHNKIEANKINFSNGKYGVRYYHYKVIDSADDIVDNAMHVNNGTGIYFNWAKDSINILYNSIHITGSSHPNIYNSWEIKIKLLNNILSNTTNNYILNDYRNSVTGDYNCFYHPLNKISYYREDLNDIHNHDNKEQHSFEINPCFISDSNLLTHNPWLNDAATPIQEITTDIDGNIRNSSTPDIGAYEFTLRPRLSGTYEIGPSAPLFKTFSDAVDSLMCVGIDDAVIFNVETGTYDEQINILQKIFGASSTKTITFQSASDDSTDVVLTYAGDYTILLNSANYIKFNKITIQTTGTDKVIYFKNCASNNIFSSNIIIGKNSTNNLVYSGSSSYNATPDSNIVFSNNLFVNGKNAVYVERGTKKVYINSNNFINQSSNAVFAYNANVSEINGNYFNSNTAYTAINIVNTDNLCKSISANRIICKYGTLNESCLRIFGANNSNDTSLISNNFIYLNTTNTDKAVLLFNTKTTLEIINNTVHVTGDNTGSYCLYTNGGGTNNYKYIVNNNFANFAGGQTMYNYYTPTSDYNNFYTTGSTLLNGRNLESWQYYFHQDSNSISVNPYFVTDTSWQVQSIFLNNSGIPVDSVTTDIEGDPRDVSTPDIGADEFTPPYSPMHGIYTIGSASADFATIQGAVDTLDMRGVDGAVTFKIANGTYNEQVVISTIYGISETNTVTFTSASSDSSKVILTFSPDVSGSDKYTLKLLRTAYIVFDKITITNGNEGTTPVVFKSANNITFSNNIIKAFSSNDNLILIDQNYSYVPDNKNLVFRGNYFTHGNMAIKLNNTDSITISNNKFTDIQSVTDYGRPDNSLISGNIINAKLTSNNTIISLGKNSKITNNVIYVDNSNNYSCTAVTTEKNSLSAFNNIVIDGGGQSYCILLSYDSCSVYNNILHSEEYCVRVNDTSGLKMNNNIYYSLNRGNDVIFALNDYRSLEQWQNDFHFDSASVIQKIEFNNDTTLYAESSWLNNTGIPINGITTDINGKLRNAVTPDIGAYELDGTIQPLSGAYTVGAGGHFASLSQANDSLKICGVKDSVIFSIIAGTYNDRIILQNDSIKRYPQNAKIVYQSASGDNNSVVLTYNSGDENNKIIYLDSIDNVTIKNLTIEAPYDNTTKAVFANHICNNLVFENNIVKNGKYGFILFSGNDSYSTNVNITNNIFTNQYYNAVYVNGADLSKINANTVNHDSLVQDSAWIGVAVLNFAQDYGHNSYVTNNMISFNATGKSAGIHLYNCNHGYVNVLFNSVNVYGEAENSRALNIENSTDWKLYFYNNIFINHAKGFVVYGNINKTDYNNMATNGENFAYAGSYYTSLSDWQYNANKDKHSVGYDSVFVSDTDLHIKNYILTGKAFADYFTATDFDGEARDTSYLTIGADKPALNYSSPLSGVYTIGNSGDFGSFSEATYAMGINGISGSVDFKILAGTYNDQLDLFYVKNISSDDTITIESQSGNKDAVTIKYNAESRINTHMIPFDNFIFRIRNVENIAIKNLTLQALDSLSNRIIVIEDSIKNVTISGNNIIGFKDVQYAASDDDNSVCIQLEGKYDTPYIKIIDNNIKYNSAAVRDYARWNDNADSSESITIEGNTIFESGIYIYKSKQVSVLKNTMSNKDKAFAYNNFIGIGSDTAVVAYNKFNYNSNAYFDLLEINTPVSFFNNFISFNNQGTNNYKLISLNNQNSVLFNNTIYCFGTQENNNSSNLIQLNNNAVAKNNIIVNASNGKTLSGGISDYNDIYPNLDERQAAGNDIHSVSFMPDFVSDTDLHTNSALLYQKGIVISEITEDIDGEARNNPPCIGADEFTNPVFNAGCDTVFCYNDQYFNETSYVYDIGSSYDTYHWSNGSDSSSVLIDTLSAVVGTNTYTVTVTVGTNTYTDTVNIIYDLPQVLLVDKYCYQNGDTITLTACDAESYKWSTGDTTQTVKVSNSNTVTVTVTDSYGCKNKASAHLTVPIHIANINIKDDTTISQSQSIEIKAANYSSEDELQYYGFNWSTGDTTYAIIFNGSDYSVGNHKVYVDVTDRSTELGCQTSDTVIVIVIEKGEGIDAFDNKPALLRIYPNPASSYISVEADKRFGKVTLSITDLNGKILYVTSEIDFSGGQKIDVSHFSAGIYLINIVTKDKVFTNRIVIEK